MNALQTSVDCTYLVNLLERHDRLVDSIVELNAYKIAHRRWVAIKDPIGASGLKRTMRALFEHSLAKQYERVLVFEDDIHFLSDPEIYASDIMDHLPTDFDLFYLGCNLLLPPERISPHVLRIKAAYATHAILYSRKAMEQILDYLDEDAPYDMILVKWLQNQGNCYCSYPMLATQRRSVSDISDFNNYRDMPGLSRYLDFQNNIILWDVMMKDRFESNTKNI